MPYNNLRRQAVPQQYAQQLQTSTLAAPTRGLIQNESSAFMGPGGAIVQDNWFPTLRGVQLRGGFERWNDLHALDYPAWTNSHAYAVDGTIAYDPADGTAWLVAVAHTSAASPTTFSVDRAAHPTYWTAQPAAITREPVISAFEYVSGNEQKMFAANSTKLLEVTFSAAPILVKNLQTSGNYCAAQMSNAGGNWLIAVNESGDPPLRFDGTAWEVLSAGFPTNPITGPPGTPVVDGGGLSYVWKYRNRLFFIGAGTMSAWYLDIDSVGGALQEIPLSGSAAKGGSLLFGADWSIDAGDGIDDKCVFVTDLGEVLIFTGSDPSNAANWRQEGRYSISPPLGMNAHVAVGGELLILTVDGIVPISQAITKTGGQLDMAMLTRPIEVLWHQAVDEKRTWAWSAKKWDEKSAVFIATPGGNPGDRYCLVVNNTTIAWCRYLGYDAVCFIRMRGDMFFGTQDGLVMQCERTGYDDGKPYVATLVGGWEMFGAPANTVTWHQCRAVFRSGIAQPFYPQLSATTDYVVTIPTPPPPGVDPGVQDVWDQGKWGPTGSGDLNPPPPADIAAYAQWDQPSVRLSPVRNTLWVSIGMTGFAHAPIVQVTVAQQATPDVELLALSTTYERAGVNV